MPRREAQTVELQDLLDQAAAGDEAARAEIISRASARLLQLTRKMFRAYPRLQRWEQTDDVMQQAAFRLYRALKDTRPGTVREFFGLAALQIRRTLIDLARHHFGPEGAASHHHSDVGQAAAALRHRPPAASEPESLADWTRFHEIIDLLPDDEQEVFALTWYSGLAQGRSPGCSTFPCRPSAAAGSGPKRWCLSRCSDSHRQSRTTDAP